LLADDLIFSEESCLNQLKMVYKDIGSSVIGVNEVAEEDISKYGVIEPNYEDSNIKINNIVEKPSIAEAPSNLAVVGRYILNSEIFKYLEKVDEDSSNEIQLTDAIKLMLSDHEVYACKYKGSKFDCGSKKGFVAATVYKGLQDEDIYKAIHDLVQKS
jgi:UTP--glucose-1-phosphate uridylyltransferase